MIGRLTGKLETITLDRVIVDVRGVGYEVQVPTGLSGRLESDAGEVTLHVHTNVRDDAIDLYGFRTREQRELFEELTGVSGVGPKTALGVLSAMQPAEVVQAVRQNSLEDFKSVKGIGEKTAQRLLLDMKSKVSDMAFDEIAPPEESAGPEDQRVRDLRSALSNFGYDDKTIDSVLAEMDDELEEADAIEPLIRQALSVLR
jgi:Holliday junction DNA helicase RuvA